MDILGKIREKGFTLSQVAEQMGTSQPSLSIIIKRGNLSVKTLRRMADVIGINFVEFFEDEYPSAMPQHLTFENTITLNGETYGLVKIEKS